MSSSNITIDFANHNYIFDMFQTQYRKLCEEISQEKRRNVGQVLKKVKSFIMEYFTYIVNKEVKATFLDSINDLRKELLEDKEFSKLCLIKDKSISQEMYFNERYYYYFIRICRVLGLYGDELSGSLNVNRTDRKKLLKYTNNHAFFEQFAIYKSNCSIAIADFSINKFKDSFCYFIGFYFAYYLFIDDTSRFICEKVFSGILSVYLSQEILKNSLKKKSELSDTMRNELENIDFELHNSLTNIFFRVNHSYSEYGLMPRVQTPIYIDTTGI